MIRQLPFDQWPSADRQTWDALFLEGDILDGEGPARHWRPATRRTNERAYGLWLGWLKMQGLLSETEDPVSRATQDQITAYARDYRDQVAPRTLASSLIHLKCVLIKMAPHENWRGLKDLTNRLDAWAKPSKAYALPEQSAPELFGIVLKELEYLAGGASTATPKGLSIEMRSCWAFCSPAPCACATCR